MRLLTFAATLIAGFVFVACTSSDEPEGAAGRVAVPSLNVIAQEAAEEGVVACGDPGDLPAWSPSNEPSVIPVIMSSLVSAGPSRFLFNVTDADYRVVSSPDVPVEIDFYALGRDPDTPAGSSVGAYLDTQLGRGLYRAAVDFDCAGEWGAEVRVTLTDGSSHRERMRFTVHPQGTTPAIGAPAPRSDSPTASSAAELRLVSTDPDPYPGSFSRTVGQVVTAGEPSLVFFATPAFCQTGYCGPTVSLVKSVAIDYEDRIGFVNVEPYELHMTENGLQPLLDEHGQLVPVQAVLDYGIPVEPYLFLVDAEGNVYAKFEGVVGADELRASIEDVLAEAAA